MWQTIIFTAIVCFAFAGLIIDLVVRYFKARIEKVEKDYQYGIRVYKDTGVVLKDVILRETLWKLNDEDFEKVHQKAFSFFEENIDEWTMVSDDKNVEAFRMSHNKAYGLFMEILEEIRVSKQKRKIS